MRKVFRYLVFLFVILQTIYNVTGDCLNNLRIVNNGDSSALTLGWDYKCGQCSQCEIEEVNKITFKIYWEHEKWLACDVKKNNRSKGPGEGHTDIEGSLDNDNYFQVDIPIRLFPYSLYKLTVKALPNYIIKRRSRPEEKYLDAETNQGIPEIAPSRSLSLEDPRPTSNSLKFNWNEPEQSKCEYFNAELDGYLYEFKGTSDWNRDHVENKSTTEHWKLFQGLMPFSAYSLNVYVKTVTGEYNSNLPLTLMASTKSADKASAPRNLKITEINDGSQHLASWLPSYPPTGQIGHYSIQWKEAHSNAWIGSRSIDVYPPFKECQKQDHYTINSYEKRLCHPINITNEISNYKNITYRMIAFNSGSVEPSDPSKAVFPIPDDTGELNAGFLILYVVIGIAALLLLVLIIVCICNRRKYSKVPDYESRPSIIIDHRRNSHPTSVPMPPPHSPPRISRNGSNLSNRSGNTASIQDIKLNSMGRPPSITTQPLPPIPGSEPLYEELPQDKVPDKTDTHDSSKELASTTILDEDGYLPPKALKKGQEYDSEDNDDEYLKPTFGKFQRIDSRDLSPPHEQPPPIPIQSYSQVPQQQQNYSNHEEKC